MRIAILAGLTSVPVATEDWMGQIDSPLQPNSNPGPLTHKPANIGIGS